jgi:hypothetical protein
MSWSAFITRTYSNETIIGRSQAICQREIKTPFKRGIYVEGKASEEGIEKKIYVNLEVQMHASIHATALRRQLKARPKKD